MFWSIVEAARSEADRAEDAFDEILVRELAGRPPGEILEFQLRFDELHDALYRWDVWAAAYLIGGGCSDDSFMDFRAAVISLGREWYERVVAAPDSLADHPLVVEHAQDDSLDRPEQLFCEEVNYVASRAYERIAGDEDAFYEALNGLQPDADAGRTEEDMGEDFDFDNATLMARRLPRLVGCLPQRA